MTTQRIYISGAISGFDLEKVRLKFKEAEVILRSHGYSVVNPLDIEQPNLSCWGTCMVNDLKELVKCNAIYMLNDWYKSEGAKIEHAFAVRMGLNIYYQGEL